MALPIIPNIAKGRFVELCKLGAANDALIAIPLESSGLEADSTLIDYDDVAALLAAANNEQTTMGRKTLTGVTVTVDDTNNRHGVDCDDVTWPAATGNAVGAILFAYDYDTTSGTDSTLIPVFIDAFVVTPSGSTITYQVNASGFARAS